MKTAAFMFGLALLACGACFPVFDDQPTLVSGPRILAVKSEPPEADRLARVTFQALVASPEGTREDPPVEWALCLRARTLAERNGVTPECLGDEAEVVQPMDGPSVEVPMDACARFGPNPPPAIDPAQPQLRPADPDLTGGYFLPVRARIPAEGLVSFGFERLRCALASAPRDIFTEFQRRYTNNVNPELEAVEGVPLDSAIAAGSRTRLRVTWPAGAAELYPYYDPIPVKLVDRVEALSVSWFASRGRFEAEKSGRTEDETKEGATSVENDFLAPLEAGPVHLWFVLRDSRGGVAWRAVTIEVR